MMIDVQDKEIRGINFKQVAAYTVTLTIFIGIYFDIRSSVNANQELLERLERSAQEDKRVREMQLKNIEDNQRALDLRLTVLETVLKK